MSRKLSVLLFIFSIFALTGCEPPTREEVAKGEIANILMLTIIGYGFGFLGYLMVSKDHDAVGKVFFITSVLLLLGSAISGVVGGDGVHYMRERHIYGGIAAFGLAIHLFIFLDVIGFARHILLRYTEHQNFRRKLRAEEIERQRKIADAKSAELDKKASDIRHNSDQVLRIIDQISLYADGLDGDADDVGILDQMFRETTLLLTLPGVGPIVSSNALLQSEIREIIGILRNFGYENKAIGRRLAALLA